jgi:hypothetical protein
MYENREEKGESDRRQTESEGRERESRSERRGAHQSRAVVLFAK